MLVFALAMHADGFGAADCHAFPAGPAEGMCPGPVVERFDNGFEIIALLPAAASGPDLAPETAKTIAGLLESRSKELAGFPQDLLAEGATGEFCTKFSAECMTPAPLKPWPLSREFVPSRPYQLRDGRIRIEWARNGKLEYLSFIRLDGAKVRDISTAPAQVPRMRTG